MGSLLDGLRIFTGRLRSTKNWITLIAHGNLWVTRTCNQLIKSGHILDLPLYDIKILSIVRDSR